MRFIFAVLIAFNMRCVNAAEVKACFTPGEACAGQIINLIDQAKTEVLVLAYALTSDSIAKSLINAHKRDLPVAIIMDRAQQAGKGSKAPLLKENGVAIFTDPAAIGHNKVIVIDRQIVVTGSYNFSENAESKNAENVVIINDKGIANRYIQNFFSRYRSPEESKSVKRKKQINDGDDDKENKPKHDRILRSESKALGQHNKTNMINNQNK